MKEEKMNQDSNNSSPHQSMNQQNAVNQNTPSEQAKKIAILIRSNPTEIFKEEKLSYLRDMAAGVSSSGLRKYFQALRKLENMIRKTTSQETEQQRIKEIRIEVALLAAYLNYDEFRKGSALYGKKDITHILRTIFETLLTKAEEAERNSTIKVLSERIRVYRKFAEILVAYGKTE